MPTRKRMSPRAISAPRPAPESAKTAQEPGSKPAPDTLSITDNRTGTSYEIPITDGTIRAIDLRQIKTGPEDFGLMAYDPAFQNTAACRSAITEIDGDKG